MYRKVTNKLAADSEWSGHLKENSCFKNGKIWIGYLLFINKRALFQIFKIGKYISDSSLQQTINSNFNSIFAILSSTNSVEDR